MENNATPPASNKNNKIIFFAAAIILLVGVFFAASTLFKKSQTKKMGMMAQKNSKVFARSYSPRYGDKNAKVILTEFLDPECESCRAFYLPVKKLLGEFPGQVQLVIRYAPFHKNSKIAIRALEAARLQGKYWEAIEMLFHYQPYWADHHNPKPQLIFEYFTQLGLDMDKLKSDMRSAQIQAIIDQDMQDLRTLGVRKTPSFFVNGRPLERFGLQFLRELIVSELEASK